MSRARDRRTLALQTLYQLDARGPEDADAVREATMEDARERDVDESVAHEAFEMAMAAYRGRREADAAVAALAPEWPSARQPAVDRAILRLAHYEIASGVTPPKVAVNEAVELAKRFGSERSPAFVNGVLDKVLKQALAAPGGERRED